VPASAQIEEWHGNALAFHPSTTVARLPAARMRARRRLSFLLEAVLSYRRARPLLFGWLERVQVRIGSYGPDGAARKRDREEFEGDFGEGFERI